MNFARKAIALTSAISLMLSSIADTAMAAQVGQNVTGAGVTRTFDAATNTTTWTQTQARAIQDMTSANIAAGETLNINMPSANSFQLNRVNSASHTTWEGALNINQGNVWFKNPNGFVTGPGFRGDVSNLGLSTHDNAVFDGDNIKFSGNSGGKIIMNAGGQVNVSPGGYLALVGPNDITNSATINAKLGTVELASVKGATVDMNGNGKITFLTTGADIDSAVVTNNGTINAEGGVVKLRADKAANVANSVINLNGIVNVTGADATTFAASTAKNGGELHANSYGSINSNTTISAPYINLETTTGDINLASVESVNLFKGNTDTAINIKSGKDVNITGDVTVLNMLATSATNAQRTKANADILAAKNITIGGDTTLGAIGMKGGDAKLVVTATDGNILTKGEVAVGAFGERVMSNTVNASDVVSTAEAKFTGKAITHEKDVNVDSYAFHDMRTLLSFVSKASNEKTAIGYYVKDANGNPTTGQILFADLQSLQPSDFGEVSLLDITNLGYFIIPDASSLNSLTNKQDVTFKQVNGKWTAVTTGGQNIVGKNNAGNSEAFALFTDTTLNPSSGVHVLDSATAGNMNWEKTAASQMADMLANYDDFNFNRTDQAHNSVISTSSKYTATTTAGDYIAMGKLGITAESVGTTGTATAQATIDANQNATFKDTVDVLTASQKNSNSSLDVRAGKNIEALAAISAISTSFDKINGKAYASLNFVNNATLAGDITFRGKTLAQANGGNLALATVNADSAKNMYVHDLLGALANTTTGNDATATTTLRAKNAGNLNSSDIEFLNGSYVFAKANSSGVSGQTSKVDGKTTITLKEVLTTETQVQDGTKTETYTEVERQQTGTTTETYTEVERQQTGTTTENYTESVYQQTGTRTENYTESVYQQTGTRTESYTEYETRTQTVPSSSCSCRCSCTTTVTYKVPVTRTRTVPVYGYVNVPRTRVVPVYGYVDVPRTRVVPVYSDVTVTKTRTVPVYSDVTVTKTRQVPNYKTVTTTTEIVKPDTSGRTYGPGFSATPPSQGPYKNVFVTQTPPPFNPPENPNPKLIGLDPIPGEPVFTKLEPASGGGLFCRDVNTAAIPGLCGGAPIPMPELAPAAAPAPAPVALCKSKSTGSLVAAAATSASGGSCSADSQFVCQNAGKGTTTAAAASCSAGSSLVCRSNSTGALASAKGGACGAGFAPVCEDNQTKTIESAVLSCSGGSNLSCLSPASGSVVAANSACNAVPVYASPFRKGKTVAKKKVANLEPASGQPKCLNINGKKVCIEEAIDK